LIIAARNLNQPSKRGKPSYLGAIHLNTYTSCFRWITNEILLLQPRSLKTLINLIGLVKIGETSPLSASARCSRTPPLLLPLTKKCSKNQKACQEKRNRVVFQKSRVDYCLQGLNKNYFGCIMKKPLTICLLICLTYIPSVVKAFEEPAILDRGFVDDCIQWGGNYKSRFIQEGIAHVYINTHEEIGFQLAHPILKKMVNPRYLMRGNIITINKVTLIGPSFRYIKIPNFIMGGYLFCDLAQIPNLLYRTNLGLELIWPRYGTITLDICNPHNLFNKEKNSFYQASVKLAIIKPRILDVFTAFSCTKYSEHNQKQWAWTILGIKGQLPINKWELNQWVTLGGGIVYTPQETWVSRDNFNFSIYLQFNLLKNKPQDSLKDYLRMPIDQYAAMPF